MLILTPVSKPKAAKYDSAYALRQSYVLQYRNYILHIPQFFECDGASIPAFVWPLIGTPFEPKFMSAAFAHDWLYYTHNIANDEISREFADRLLYEEMLRSGVHSVKAWLIYKAVRIFGASYWQNQEEDLQYLQDLQEKLKAANVRNINKYGFPK